MSLIDTATLILTPNAGKTGKLYSVIPSNGNGDFTVTRATTATRTNSAGLVEVVPYNLLTWSEMFTDASWGKTASSITANTTTAPDGALTADTFTANGLNLAHIVAQTLSVVSGTSYAFSVYVKKDTNNFVQLYFAGNQFTVNAYANFDLNSGVLGTVGSAVTASITSVGNDWYRCTVVASSNATASSGINISLITSETSARAEINTLSTSVFLWGAQLVEGTSALTYQKTETRLNIPRLDYSLGSCPNLLLEPQRTNLATFSEQFDNLTFWLRSTGVSVNANTSISPSGIVNADTVIGATGPFVWLGPNTFYRPFPGMTISTSYIFSVYLKGSGTVTITWRDGTTGGTNNIVCNLTSSWQRFELARTTGAASTGMSIIFSNASGNFDAWGAQLEAGAYATSYIPTTSATVTRNADSISLGNVYTNALISASGGTWFVELRNNVSLLADDPVRSIWIGTNATTPSVNGTLLFRQGGGSGRIQIWKQTGGAGTSLFTTTTDTIKVAFKWNGTTADIFVNGTKVVSATAFPHNNMEFISANVGRTLNINQMALWATPLTDDQLELLTGDSFNTYAEMASFYNYTLQ